MVRCIDAEKSSARASENQQRQRDKRHIAPQTHVGLLRARLEQNGAELLVSDPDRPGNQQVAVFEPCAASQRRDGQTAGVGVAAAVQRKKTAALRVSGGLCDVRVRAQGAQRLGRGALVEECEGRGAAVGDDSRFAREFALGGIARFDFRVAEEEKPHEQQGKSAVRCD